MIEAIVLAAGASTRMGQQKLMLPFGGSTVVKHILGQLTQSTVDDIVVLTGHDPDCVQGLDVKTVHNAQYTDGMLSSIRVGLQAISESAEGAMIVLGDQPLIQTSTIDAVAEAFRASPDAITVPVYKERRGHPVVIPIRFIPEILTQYDEVGLRGLLRAHPESVSEIPVSSETVLVDMDYPEDYQAALRKLEESGGAAGH